MLKYVFAHFTPFIHIVLETSRVARYVQINLKIISYKLSKNIFATYIKLSWNSRTYESEYYARESVTSWKYQSLSILGEFPSNDS